mgnify:CR=1 FL=1
MLLDSFIGGIGGIVSRSAVAPIELHRIQKQNYFKFDSDLDIYLYFNESMCSRGKSKTVK